MSTFCNPRDSRGRLQIWYVGTDKGRKRIVAMGMAPTVVQGGRVGAKDGRKGGQRELGREIKKSRTVINMGEIAVTTMVYK